MRLRTVACHGRGLVVLAAGTPRPPSSPTARSRSACSTTSPASTPTLAARARCWRRKLAVEDSGGSLDGTPIEVVFADHQNKPDVGSNIARQWYDVDQVDMIVDVPNSAVALAVNEVTREKNKVYHQLRCRHLRPHRRQVLAQHGALDLRHLGARQRHRQGRGRRPAATPGSSSPPTMRSATRSSATPRRS